MEGKQDTSGLHCSYPSSKAGGGEFQASLCYAEAHIKTNKRKGKKLTWYDKPLSEIENPKSRQEHTFLLGGG